MTTFTSTLPENLFEQLNQHAKKLKVPKNRIIQKALSVYLDQLERAEYIRSYKKYKDDEDLLLIAEEGMTDYLQQLKNVDETS